MMPVAPGAGQVAQANDGPGARFERIRRIRFSHCDPAGIVYFPQYLVLFNQLVEDWFTEGMGISYADMLGKRRLGLPIVRLECDFRAISCMGEALRFGVTIERIGGKSLTLSLDAVCDTQLRVASRQVLVFTDLETHRAVPIPDDVRAALAPYQN